MIPPQEPGSFDFSVKTTGLSAVPLVINFPPFKTTNALSPVALSIVIVDPASKVTVTPALIFTIPFNV
ncbi:hypothetical protein D3C87_2093040 [compost metagenome]